MNRNCVVCGTTFSTIIEDKWTCSPKCTLDLDAKIEHKKALENAIPPIETGTSSEGELARKALGIGGARRSPPTEEEETEEPLPASIGDHDEYLAAAQKLISAVRELSNNVDRLELAQVAFDYLGRAVAILELEVN